MKMAGPENTMDEAGDDYMNVWICQKSSHLIYFLVVNMRSLRLLYQTDVWPDNALITWKSTSNQLFKNIWIWQEPSLDGIKR